MTARLSTLAVCPLLISEISIIVGWWMRLGAEIQQGFRSYIEEKYPNVRVRETVVTRGNMDSDLS